MEIFLRAEIDLFAGRVFADSYFANIFLASLRAFQRHLCGIAKGNAAMLHPDLVLSNERAVFVAIRAGAGSQAEARHGSSNWICSVLPAGI